MSLFGGMSMLKRVCFLMFCAFEISVLLASCRQSPPSFECTDQIGCVTIAPNDPIKIGVLQALTGGAAPIGSTQVRSIELALAQRDYQVLGHPIEVHIEDSRCTSEGGNMAALKLVADPQMVALLGTTCSASGTTASKVMSEAGLVMISGVNSAPSLTAINEKQGIHWRPGYFRTIYNNAVNGKVAAIFTFQELHVTNAVTIHDGDVYTQELAQVFEQTFAVLGGNIVLSATVNKGDSDMRPVLTAINASGTEFVFFSLFPLEGIHIVKQARDVLEGEQIIFMGGGALITDTFIKAVGSDGVGMYFSGTAPPEGIANDELVSEYQSTYDESPKHSAYAYAYDAANLLFHTIETVAVQEDDGTLHIGRQALRDALYATSEFKGITGSLTCDEFGDCGNPIFHIVRLEDPSKGLEGLLSNVVYRYRHNP